MSRPYPVAEILPGFEETLTDQLDECKILNIIIIVINVLKLNLKIL